jgi:aldehyde dehydrogenase (NAD+)
VIDYSRFYIDGRWVEPTRPNLAEVIDPATELPCATISLGSAADVDLAVSAARRAFEEFSCTKVEERLALLARIQEIFVRRQDDIASVITAEIGAPISFSREGQVPMALSHFGAVIQGLRDMAWTERHGTSALVREPIGVIGIITPWNWPINMVVCKTLPAIAAGCTVVLKPSEIAPLDAMIFAEICAEAGVPNGVINIVNGTGEEVGEAIASHSGIDAVSFTGSTRAGIRVAQAAAPSVKRVTQELGGKSANIILDDADLDYAVRTGADYCFMNTGQTCDAPTRMLVPAERHDEAVQIAMEVAAAVVVGDPMDLATTMGPLVTKAQFDKVQQLVEQGIAEGAELVAGGLGKPEGVDAGYFVKPTVFANVNNGMTIAQEEIFGPVLCIIPYDSDSDAIRIANDSPYGLAGYVVGTDIERARRVASGIKAGMVFINYPEWDATMPFGGYKQSGNGRESGAHGISEYLEIKSIIGFG